MLYGSFANYGFVKDTVPSDLLASLREEVYTLDTASNKYNMNLAGNLASEFKLSKNHNALEEYTVGLCKQYTSGWDLTKTAKDLDSSALELHTYWANLQQPNEINPMHTHDGMYSFAIWLDVPYDIVDEINHPSVKYSNMPRAGMFSFIYTNIFGEVREAEFPVDRSYEGSIFLFPSCLPHMVYPYRSTDRLRVSISGNLRRKL